MERTVILATTNRGKLKEFETLFAGFGIPLSGFPHSPGPSPEENARDFSGNADIKARFYSRFFSKAVLADDSGLCVDALGGGPGVRSSRFAGENANDCDNNALLLEKLADVPPGARTARFVCCLSLAAGGVVLERSRGDVEGVILESPRGGRGFGYDPLFFYPPMQKTFAEMNVETKNRFSHRFRACEAMADRIRKRTAARPASR